MSVLLLLLIKCGVGHVLNVVSLLFRRYDGVPVKLLLEFFLVLIDFLQLVHYGVEAVQRKAMGACVAD